MSMEEYEIACLKREWEAERERERQDLLRIEEPTRLEPRTYAVTEGWDDSKHYWDIAYRVSETTDKMIRFSLIEHYLQFIDLLAEAGYKYFDDKLRFTNDIK